SDERVRFERFQRLAAQLATRSNFFADALATRSASRGATTGGPAGPFGFGLGWRKMLPTRKRAHFAMRNETFPWRGVSHWNRYGRRISHFAGSGVFKGLPPVSFRRFCVAVCFQYLSSNCRFRRSPVLDAQAPP